MTEGYVPRTAATGKHAHLPPGPEPKSRTSSTRYAQVEPAMHVVGDFSDLPTVT